MKAVELSSFIQKNRFDSFAPPRDLNKSKVFINSENYYSSLFEAFSSAEHEIFIRGWWLSPNTHLKRPVEEYPESRLDNVLHSAALRYFFYKFKEELEFI